MNHEELLKSCNEEVKNTEDLIKIYKQKINLYQNDIQNMQLRTIHFKKQIAEILKNES